MAYLIALAKLFLDLNSSDSVLCLGNNINPKSCQIVSEVLENGSLFINESDVKRVKDNFNISCSNCCAISYQSLEIPDFSEFDKVVCFAPSSEDGMIRNKPGVNSLWSLNKCIENHEFQKHCHSKVD